MSKGSGGTRQAAIAAVCVVAFVFVVVFEGQSSESSVAAPSVNRPQEAENNLDNFAIDSNINKRQQQRRSKEAPPIERYHESSNREEDPTSSPREEAAASKSDDGVSALASPPSLHDQALIVIATNHERDAMAQSIDRAHRLGYNDLVVLLCHDSTEECRRLQAIKSPNPFIVFQISGSTLAYRSGQLLITGAAEFLGSDLATKHISATATIGVMDAFETTWCGNVMEALHKDQRYANKVAVPIDGYSRYYEQYLTEMFTYHRASEVLNQNNRNIITALFFGGHRTVLESLLKDAVRVLKNDLTVAKMPSGMPAGPPLGVAAFNVNGGQAIHAGAPKVVPFEGSQFALNHGVCDQMLHSNGFCSPGKVALVFDSSLCTPLSFADTTFPHFCRTTLREAAYEFKQPAARLLPTLPGWLRSAWENHKCDVSASLSYAPASPTYAMCPGGKQNLLFVMAGGYQTNQVALITSTFMTIPEVKDNNCTLLLLLVNHKEVFEEAIKGTIMDGHVLVASIEAYESTHRCNIFKFPECRHTILGDWIKQNWDFMKTIGFVLTMDARDAFLQRDPFVMFASKHPEIVSGGQDFIGAFMENFPVAHMDWLFKLAFDYQRAWTIYPGWSFFNAALLVTMPELTGVSGSASNVEESLHIINSGSLLGTPKAFVEFGPLYGTSQEVTHNNWKSTTGEWVVDQGVIFQIFVAGFGVAKFPYKIYTFNIRQSFLTHLFARRGEIKWVPEKENPTRKRTYLNCLDEPYAIVHQLDRHADLWQESEQTGANAYNVFAKIQK